MARSEPIVFGKYKLRCLLGAGAMARVYRAEAPGALGFKKTLALKMLDPRVSRNKKFIQALINEARIGAGLKSPYVIEILEFNHVQGNYYLAMEYVDGWTLEAVMEAAEENGRFLPVAVAARIGAQIALGVQAAHELKDETGRSMELVHRDLKPGNVMLNRDGHARVMDFGIAKARSNVARTTASDGPKGTPIFMSPEQITTPGDIDFRSDLFSLGTLLCELLTFRTPFDADNPLVVMRRILYEETDEFLAGIEEKAPGMGPIIGRCLERNPADRWRSAGDLAKALHELAEVVGEGVSVRDFLNSLEALPEGIEDGDFGPGSFIPEFGEPHVSSAPASAPQLPVPPITQSTATTSQPEVQPRTLPSSGAGPVAVLESVVATVPQMAATSVEQPNGTRRRLFIRGLLAAAFVLLLVASLGWVLRSRQGEAQPVVAALPVDDGLAGMSNDAAEAGPVGVADGTGGLAEPNSNPGPVGTPSLGGAVVSTGPVKNATGPKNALDTNDGSKPPAQNPEVPTDKSNPPTEPAKVVFGPDPAGGLGRININAEPPYARVFLNGVDLNYTPVANKSHGAGLWPLVVECHDGTNGPVVKVFRENLKVDDGVPVFRNYKCPALSAEALERDRARLDGGGDLDIAQHSIYSVAEAAP